MPRLRVKPPFGRSRVSSMVAGILMSVWLLAAVTAAAKDKDNKPAAQPYALIYGTVWNAHDFPAPGVKVKICRAGEKKPRWELVSNRRGEFIQRVPAAPADYRVWAEVKGHKGPAAETTLHIEFDERRDIGLHLTE